MRWTPNERRKRGASQLNPAGGDSQMISKQLEEMGVTWSKVQAKAQDRLEVLRFDCGLLSQLG